MGYRQLSEFINIKYNLTVSKEQVRKCLEVVDRESVNERWRKVKRRRIYKNDEPGDVFHIDGNDKFKRWGLPVHLTSFHRSKEVMSLHKTSFANEEIPEPKICRNGKILRINDFRGKFTKKVPAACFKLVLLVLNENKISKPKNAGELLKHAGECLDSICLNSCSRLKTKQNVLICHGNKSIKVLNRDRGNIVNTNSWKLLFRKANMVRHANAMK